MSFPAWSTAGACPSAVMLLMIVPVPAARTVTLKQAGPLGQQIARGSAASILLNGMGEGSIANHRAYAWHRGRFQESQRVIIETAPEPSRNSGQRRRTYT